MNRFLTWLIGVLFGLQVGNVIASRIFPEQWSVSLPIGIGCLLVLAVCSIVTARADR